MCVGDHDVHSCLSPSSAQPISFAVVVVRRQCVPLSCRQCINSSCLIVTTASDRSKLKDEKIYLGLRFQRVSVHPGGEGVTTEVPGRAVHTPGSQEAGIIIHA